MAWARHISALIGDVDAEIHAAGVLNLSGTLWRSNASERISTVRYQRDDEGRLVSDVDFEVTAAELIRDAQLRPVDLFRGGATVELVNLAAAERLVAPIADLDERSAARAAIRELPSDPAWREAFVDAVLDRLERRHRDLGNGPAKALIVARSQEDARAFQDTTNRLMRSRNQHPFAELAVSDDPEAHKVLTRFRAATRPGVLCTVDMAGEGYDCPEIVVVGFATNKLTHLYVRQVVARAQRVTQYEREQIGRPIPAAVVIPDVPELVEIMSAILEPMRHEIRASDDESGNREIQQRFDDLGILQVPIYQLAGVADHTEGDARVTGESDGDVAMQLVRAVEPEARRVGLPESDAPRMIVAVRQALVTHRESRPFDPSPDAELAAAFGAGETAVQSKQLPVREPLSVERQATELRKDLAYLGRWWSANGNTPVEEFQADINRAGGIHTGGREDAQVDQLSRALTFARRRIALHCETTGLRRPPSMRRVDGGG